MLLADRPPWSCVPKNGKPNLRETETNSLFIPRYYAELLGYVNCDQVTLELHANSQNRSRPLTRGHEVGILQVHPLGRVKYGGGGGGVAGVAALLLPWAACNGNTDRCRFAMMFQYRIPRSFRQGEAWPCCSHQAISADQCHRTRDTATTPRTPDHRQNNQCGGTSGYDPSSTHNPIAEPPTVAPPSIRA